MGKKGNIIYIVLCLVICVLPFAGMTFYRTDTTTENKTLAEFPKLKGEKGVNLDFFEELSAYFEDHFSFRQELVSADAAMMSKVFQVSNVDTVLVGTDGWLYYTDTLNDYLGQDIMNQRQAFNTVNNLRLLQQYVTGKGADFLFTVAPNKNSLYGDNMPYYASYKAGDTKNMDLIAPELAGQEIAYADLFGPFEDREETLYLKRDSHWNNKGAILAYNTIFDALMTDHERYETVEAVREEKEYGDLNKMLYPLNAQPEWNYYYQTESHWNYTSKEQDVEGAWLETQCPEGQGNLLMFRDSFGNTLLPLMAEHFEKAAFSKVTPYPVEKYMEQMKPELVLVEKVERNLDEYMTAPPIMTGPEVTLENIEEQNAKEDKTMALQESMEDTDYYVLSGEIDAGDVPEDARIYVRFTCGDTTKTYEAFTTVTETSDYGYLLYLTKEELNALGGMAQTATLKADIITGQGDSYKLAATKELTWK